MIIRLFFLGFLTLFNGIYVFSDFFRNRFKIFFIYFLPESRIIIMCPGKIIGISNFFIENKFYSIYFHPTAIYQSAEDKLVKIFNLFESMKNFYHRKRIFIS